MVVTCCRPSVAGLDDVVGVVYLGHPLGLGCVLFPEVGVVDGAEVAGVDVDGRGGVPDVTEGSQGALLAEVPLAVRGGLGEDDHVLLVVGVRPLDQPHAHAVRITRHV